MERRSRPQGKAPALLLACAALAALASGASALDWPLADPKPAATFGTAAKGRFVSGILLASEGGLVRAAGDGELVYAFDGSSPTAVSALPSTLGSFAVVEHERGMAGLYAGLAPGSVSSYLTKTKAGSILGTAGASGWAEGQGLLFAVYDRGAERWVNPLLLLPALKDKTQPLIRSAALARGGKSYALGETRSVPQGEYAIAVDVADPLDAPWSAGSPAPYYLRLLVDGAKIAELEYDVMEGRSGRLVLFPQAPKSRADYLLPDGRALVAERFFRRGRSVIEVLVRDYAGNERGASWSIAVE